MDQHLISTTGNPFPGPRPYEAADRAYFCGRDDITQKLLNRLLAYPCIVVHGPSGAGKSSVIAAGVVPRLTDDRDPAFRVLQIRSWPSDREPLALLVRELHAKLEIGPLEGEMPTLRGELSETERQDRLDACLAALEQAIYRAERRSDRPILLYLDQLEQLFFTGRPAADADALLRGLDRVAGRSARGVQILLAMREDYLGRFRDRAKGLYRLLEHGFRVGPLTVGEMVTAVCDAANKSKPKEPWNTDDLRPLMMAVRVSGEEESDAAQVQAAFGQIVCLARWNERAEGRKVGIEPKQIVIDYMKTTIARLASLEKKTRSFLEKTLVDDNGLRKLPTRDEVEAELGDDADRVLEVLENARILRHVEHEGRRIYELGHDWLAEWLFEGKKKRSETQKWVGRLKWIAVVTSVVMGLLAGLAMYQWRKADEATKEAIKWAKDAEEAKGKANDALDDAEWNRFLEQWAGFDKSDALEAAEEADRDKDEALGAAVQARIDEAKAADGEKKARQRAEDEKQNAVSAAERARDNSLVTLAQTLSIQHESSLSAAALLHVKDPESAANWSNAALDSLQGTRAFSIRRIDPDHLVVGATWSADGERILTRSSKVVQVWDAGGRPVRKDIEHDDFIFSAGFDVEGSRLLTVTNDGNAHVWRLPARDTGDREGRTSDVPTTEPTPGDTGGPERRKATATPTRGGAPEGRGKARLPGNEGAAGGDDSRPVDLRPFRDPIRCIAVRPTAREPDSKPILTVSESGTIRRWSLRGGTPEIVLKRRVELVAAACSADASRVFTVGVDRIPHLWSWDDPGNERVLDRLPEHVVSAEWTADQRRIVTVSNKGVVRILTPDGQHPPIVVPIDHGEAVLAAQSLDGTSIVTASKNGAVVVYRTKDLAVQTVFQVGVGALQSLASSGSGEQILTVSKQGRAQVWRIVAPSPLRGHGGAVRFASFSRDRTRVATASSDRTVRVWNTDRSGAPLVLRGHTGAVHWVAFSPDGARVVSASEDGTVRVWSASGRTGSAALDTGETRVVMILADDTIAWSDGATREPNTQGSKVIRPSIPAQRVAFVTAAEWPSGARSDPMQRRAGSFPSIDVNRALATMLGMSTVSPDATRLARAENWYSAPRVRISSLIDSGSGTSFDGPGGEIEFVAFSPDGARFVAAGDSGKVLLRNTDGTGRPLLFTAHTRKVNAATFSLDGQHVVTASDDGTAQIWPVSIASITKALEDTPVGCFSAEMRVLYLEESPGVARERQAACERAR